MSVFDTTSLYTDTELEAAYQSGIEDLAGKLIGLIRGSDYDITLEQIEQFIEFELSYHPGVDTPRWARELIEEGVDVYE